ncbi:MAG: hypothetical protein HXX18_06940 [Bacteroidetes bacterium]|nr:hypothetical protein [Bacteroidota bacterium]
MIRNRELCRKISNLDDFVFNDSVNKTSLLHIANRHTTITIATIPIDDIIIDDSKELILCLSRAIISPYQIVLYNFDGKLLFKKIISPFEIVLDSINYVQFCDSFPAFLQYAINEKQILFEKGLYYIDLGYWKFLSKEEKEKIQSKKWYKQSHYFPNLFPEYINSNSSARLSKYTNFYSLTDPFYEFEMYQPSQPIGIILNDEFGGKVTIPLSFCSFSGRPE